MFRVIVEANPNRLLPESNPLTPRINVKEIPISDLPEQSSVVIDPTMGLDHDDIFAKYTPYNLERGMEIVSEDKPYFLKIKKFMYEGIRLTYVVSNCKNMGPHRGLRRGGGLTYSWSIFYPQLWLLEPRFAPGGPFTRSTNIDYCLPIREYAGAMIKNVIFNLDTGVKFGQILKNGGFNHIIVEMDHNRDLCIIQYSDAVNIYSQKARKGVIFRLFVSVTDGWCTSWRCFESVF